MSKLDVAKEQIADGAYRLDFRRSPRAFVRRRLIATTLGDM